MSGALGSLCWFDVIVIGQRGHHFAMYYSVPPLEVLLLFTGRVIDVLGIALE